MYIPSFKRLASIVFKLSKDPDFSGQTDGLTDGRTEGKPIVPSGVNTGRGLIIDKAHHLMIMSSQLPLFVQMNYALDL